MQLPTIQFLIYETPEISKFLVFWHFSTRVLRITSIPVRNDPLPHLSKKSGTLLAQMKWNLHNKTSFRNRFLKKGLRFIKIEKNPWFPLQPVVGSDRPYSFRACTALLIIKAKINILYQLLQARSTAVHELEEMCNIW